MKGHGMDALKTEDRPKIFPGSYEDFRERCKTRDGNRCTEPGCTRNPHWKMLRVVRIDPWKADSMTNLRTVCKWHAPSWEGGND